MTNTELIDLFRNVERSNHPVCNGCPMKYTCDKNQITRCLFGSVADALEAAEQQIAIVEEERDLERFAAKNYLDKIDELEKELEIWTVRSFEGKIGRMAFINLNLKKEISELRAQLPKEGEWLDETDGRYFWHGKCSICNHEYNIDSYYGDMKYCPNCGAKMDGERKDGEG